MPATKVRFALVCLLVVLLPGCAREPGTDTTSSPDAFAREWLSAWTSQDVDEVLTFYTEDAFYEDVPAVENGWGGPARGHEMIRESLTETFEEMSDLRFELVSASDAGDRMVVEWVMIGTHYRDYSGEFSIRGVSLIELEGNRIASVSDYYDAFLLLSQLGMLPALSEAPEETSGDSAAP
jgi:steroid delta-isomerase-like uncharacterized protein